MFHAKCNYKIYDKKLLAIIQAFKKWRLKLAETFIKNSIYVITNYKNLVYFISINNLKRRQAH